MTIEQIKDNISEAEKQIEDILSELQIKNGIQVKGVLLLSEKEMTRDGIIIGESFLGWRLDVENPFND